MFVRILNSEMELATGCTEPGAVALTAAEAGAALRKAGGTRVEAVTVRASINIIKNAMSAGIPGTSYQGMDYAAAIGAVGGDPVHLLEVMNYVPREQMEEAAALVGAGKVKVVLTLRSGTRQILATDGKTTEKGESIDSQVSTVVVSKGSGNEETVALQELAPQYQGALVVCPGGNDPAVKLQISEAVAALTGLGADKISICKGN